MNKVLLRNLLTWNKIPVRISTTTTATIFFSEYKGQLPSRDILSEYKT